MICSGTVSMGGADGCLEILGPRDLWDHWECCEERCTAWALGEVKGRWMGRAQWLELLRHP
ncbi:MAG: hypothetical protein NZ610_07980 [Candidatus Bipolaricaulota bacterium]|nr:hypothetical protein [Candidatus Bipolaricaulota bacterium]MCS7275315.1 hypothetical protein [Candidatus Bipolaricaulota bacterium]MDW8110186.1 hypothetical protein [Candidatus Bipolaricaulota bacterium]